MIKATNTHSDNVILVALAQQQWLRERASRLRYTHIACLVCIRFLVSSLCVHKKMLVLLRDLGLLT